MNKGEGGRQDGGGGGKREKRYKALDDKEPLTAASRAPQCPRGSSTSAVIHPFWSCSVFKVGT